MDPYTWGRRSFVFASGALALGLSGGCGKEADPSPAAPDVQVIAVEQRDVPIVREWIGSLDGFVNAQIRAQVSGYLVRQGRGQRRSAADSKRGADCRFGTP